MVKQADVSWWTDGLFEGRPVPELLAARDIGAIFRFLKTRGWSRAAIAAATGLTETRVRAVARGNQQITSYNVLERIATGLRIERGLLGLAYTDKARRRAEPDTEPMDAGQSRGGLAASADDQRRSFLTAVGLLLGASGLLGRPATTRPRRLGASDVARLDAILALYRSMDSEVGSGALYSEVARVAEAASALQDRSLHWYPDALEPRLLASVAATRQLAGWMAFDSGRHNDAQRHLLAAERTAVASGDLLLAANVRYAQARQFQHLRHHRDAIDTVRLARDQMSAAGTPAVKARLYGTEATSLAALGDDRAAQDMLRRAMGAFERIKSDREPEWIRFFDHGELLAEHAATYRELAHLENGNRHGVAAVGWYTDAIAAFGPQQARSTVLNEVGLCSALFLADQPDRAVAVGERAVSHARHLTSRRIFDRIVNLRHDLTRHLARPDVAEFARKIASLAPA
jgi:transcriptional regulator with XRE-family HTH domain